MVIPWVGFPLANLIKRCEPTSKARFVEFTTLHDVGQMPGQRSDVLEWPYVEGLRMDEALHPLTILAVGLYGEVLPNQNGAPLARRAVEVRLQRNQVDRPDSFHREATGVLLANPVAGGIRLLRECESHGRSSRLNPGHLRPGCRRFSRPPGRSSSMGMAMRSPACIVDGPQEELLTDLSRYGIWLRPAWAAMASDSGRQNVTRSRKPSSSMSRQSSISSCCLAPCQRGSSSSSGIGASARSVASRR